MVRTCVSVALSALMVVAFLALFPAAAIATPKADTVHSGKDVWDRLAQWESSGNWKINTGNGYYGGLQISKRTWNGFKGQQYAAYPHQASRAQQIVIARRILKVQGWKAWPTCSRRIGVR